MPSNHYYNKNLKTYARENRMAMTKAEACLWKYALSKRQMLGQQFRIQRPIGNYVVDFICLRLDLIIEVDGFSHQLPENEARERVRQEWLEAMGFTVVRFTDEAVLKNINAVREVIEGWIRKLEE